MRKAAFWTALSALALAASLFSYGQTLTTGERRACPGKIVCPLTRHLVCRDRCPLQPRPDATLQGRAGCCRLARSQGVRS